MDCAIDTVTDPEEVCGNADGHVLAFLYRARLVDCSNHDRAVDAVADLKELDVGVDVDVGVFTALDPHILALHSGAVFKRHALIQAVHVLHFPFRLMLENDLAQPVNDHVHVHFDLVACPALEEWRELRQLH